MSQYAYSRALRRLQEDLGIDRVDAEWFMKRLADDGWSVTERDPSGSGSPPGRDTHTRTTRAANRQTYLDRMRADLETAKEKNAARAAELAEKLQAEQAAQAAEVERQKRELAVQAVLAGMQ